MLVPLVRHIHVGSLHNTMTAYLDMLASPHICMYTCTHGEHDEAYTYIVYQLQTYIQSCVIPNCTRDYYSIFITAQFVYYVHYNYIHIHKVHLPAYWMDT